MDAASRDAIQVELEHINASVSAIHDIINATEEPPPPPPPPAEVFRLTVPVAKMRLRNAVSMTVVDDHVAVWGHPGEAVEFTIDAEKQATVKARLRYALAAESQTVAATRTVQPGGTVTLPVTEQKWAEAVTGLSDPVSFTVPAGESTVTISNPTTSPWSNWCDLYAVELEADVQIVSAGSSIPTDPNPPPPPPPPPPQGGTVWTVPTNGSLAQVADQARPGDSILIEGIVATNGKLLDLKNRDNGAKTITVIGQPGHVLRGGESGIEGYGACRGWSFQNLNIEVNGAAYYSEGIYFGGQRTDQGGNGKGCSRITVTGCKIRPIAGSGKIQRNGIAVWGGDIIEVGFCDIADAAFNDLGFPGGAGSGISIGVTIGAAWGPLSNGARVWLHHNKIKGMVGPGSGSFDRNGIILDLYHGSPGSALNENRMRGLTEIHDNVIEACEGRGIQLLVAGAEDSPVTVHNNQVRPPVATNLAGSEPICGIGGYGDGRCGNIEVSDNDVVTSGSPAYRFISFDAAMDSAIRGVRGTGNKGVGVSFVNSPTNTPPPRFTI